MVFIVLNMKYILSIFFLVFISNQIIAQKKSSFVRQIEKAVNVNQFKKEEAISFNIELLFGGKSSFKGEIICATNSSWIKINKEDGAQILFDGENVWLSPADKNYKGARFDIFTWQYFFMAPFKLSDKGTQWKDLGFQKYSSSLLLPSAQLTFGYGTGDASSDYYVVYKNAENLINAMGYIVTFGGKTVAEAEKSSHAIVYGNYREINGIPIAHEWYFHNWNKKDGITNEIGSAKINNVNFLKNKDINHQKMTDAIEVKL